MRKAALIISVLIALTLPFVIPQEASRAQDRRYTLTVINESSKEIHKLYMSVSRDRNWGPDLLGYRILKPGGSTALREIAPAEYDLLVVDAQENQCILRNFAVFSDTTWKIRDDWLARSCQRKG